MSNKLYLNVYDYEDDNYPFQLFTGGRGTGKTYSALSGIVGDRSRNGILMRRTADELEILADEKDAESANPFKTINKNNGYNYGLKRINDKVYGIYDRKIEGDKLIHVGRPVGLCVALSTIAKVRGMDFSNYTDLIYDEFIPEMHVKRMRGESDAFLNAYETINRNRELEGLPPLKAWLLSNSNDIYNPIFVGLGIVSDVERMARRGQEHLYIKERGLAVHLLKNTEEFQKAKEKTAIAKLTRGSTFYDMAYNNSFAYNDFTNVGFRKLVGYFPVCAIDKAYIYQKKGAREIYVSYAPCKIEKFSSTNNADRIRLRREYGIWLQPYYINGNMYFESYELKEIVLTAIM